MSKPQVLIIDDNRELADNLVEVFEARDYLVRVVPSAASGIRHAEAHGFDLAFVDVNLPDSSGTELVPKLRAAAPGGEVVLMTGDASIDSAIAAVRVGAFHYVVKPFSVTELLNTADRALQQVRLRAERQQLANELAASERRYRDVVESSGVLVVGLDRQRRVVIANRRTCTALGVTEDELTGCDFVARCVEDERRTQVIARIQAALDGHEMGAFEAAISLGKENKSRTVRWHATAAVESGNSRDAIAVYMTGTDVTEGRELERRAAESEALAHMGTLAAGLAHEIRNPLNAAGLQLHLLGRSVDRLSDDDRVGLRQRVDIVASELKRLEHLLGDFLELARPRPIARERVALHELVERVLALHDAAASARNITIDRRIAACDVRGDRERLQQVFHNLVVNALEASSDGGQIVVDVTAETESDPPIVVAAVRDEGRGIPPATLARIFEPFFTTKAAGTGLGLTIVRQIVQRHGGEVLIDSVESQGTRVALRLPAYL